MSPGLAGATRLSSASAHVIRSPFLPAFVRTASALSRPKPKRQRREHLNPKFGNAGHCASENPGSLVLHALLAISGPDVSDFYWERRTPNLNEVLVCRAMAAASGSLAMTRRDHRVGGPIDFHHAKFGMQPVVRFAVCVASCRGGHRATCDQRSHYRQGNELDHFVLSFKRFACRRVRRGQQTLLRRR